MGYWQQSVVTDAGVGMLNDLMAGRRMTICSAWGGTESAPPEVLARQTDVSGGRWKLDLLDLVKLPEGKLVRVQINNAGLNEGYTIRQIGVFARVDDEPERLLFILQEERGVEIPPVSENPSFTLEVQGLVYITNDVEIRINLEESKAIVTLDMLAQQLAGHNTDPYAHPNLLDQNNGQTTIVSIPVSAWQEDEDGPCAYRAEIACEDATAAHIPYVSLDGPSMKAAESSGLSNIAEAADGVLRFWSRTVPQTELIGRAALFGPGSGGSTGCTIPTATASRLGGIKVQHGSGLTVDPEGNIALDAATDEDVAALFDGSKADQARNK